MHTSARLGIPTPDLTDSPVDIPATWDARAAILDNLVPIDQGPLASRPVSTAGTPGVQGRQYITTDQPGGSRLDVDYGQGWFTAGPAQVDAASSVASLRTLGPGAQQAMPGNTPLVGYQTGTSAARLAATPTDGLIWRDTDDGVEYIGTGTGWKTLIGSAGSSIIAAQQATASAAYTTLATPDQVTVVVPTNGRLEVLFQAAWMETNSMAGRAAIFINGNQLCTVRNLAAPAPVAATTGASAVGTPINMMRPLTTCGIGLVTPSAPSGFAYTGDVNTGQTFGGLMDNAIVDVNGATFSLPGESVVGGPCAIFGPTGTVTVSVQFKASAGSVAVVNRKLFVRAISNGN